MLYNSLIAIGVCGWKSHIFFYYLKKVKRVGKIYF